MKAAVDASWVLLALVHLAPSAVLVAPSMVVRLYGVEPDGDLGILMRHRGALFFAIVCLSVVALFDPGARRAAGLAVAVSVFSFLFLYARSGFPAGSLRAIAIVDAVAVAPLLLVLYAAWGQPA